MKLESEEDVLIISLHNSGMLSTIALQDAEIRCLKLERDVAQSELKGLKSNLSNERKELLNALHDLSKRITNISDSSTNERIQEIQTRLAALERTRRDSDDISRNERQQSNRSEADRSDSEVPSALRSVLRNAHDVGCTLYLVNVTSCPQVPSATLSLAPSLDETRGATPYARSYYCPAHNGWAFLLWGNATTLPPLTRPIDGFPESARRSHTSSCIGDVGPLGRINEEHDWHRYERAVNSGNNPMLFGKAEDTQLDLYLCSQCMTYCTVSDICPGVVPEDLHRAFTRNKWDNPSPGYTPKASVLAAWESVAATIQNRLWKNEHRSIPVNWPRFQRKVGWDDDVQRIFEILEFEVGYTEAYSAHNPEAGGGLQLLPKDIDRTTSEGRRIRAKLLRAWLEISAWRSIYLKL
ncbi:hypothetical protein C8Q72DRAFT_820752, partial [Fomitopsis betulina]